MASASAVTVAAAAAAMADLPAGVGGVGGGSGGSPSARAACESRSCELRSYRPQGAKGQIYLGTHYRVVHTLKYTKGPILRVPS